MRCGDDETVREVVAQQVTGSAAPFVKKIVRGQDQSQLLMQQILRGVYGEDWRREVSASTSFTFVVSLNKQQIVDCNCTNNYGRPELFISDFSARAARFGR